MYPDTHLLINGTWVAGSGGQTIDVVNPATAKVIGQVAHARISDLERAVAAAEQGFAIWRSVSGFDRYGKMRQAATLLRERVQDIAAIMATEQGKPLAESQGETRAAADVIDWFAEEARRTYGRIIPARMSGFQQAVIREPVGPVAAFTPWNFPINQAVRKVAAALAAGCSIIVKGPEETPASLAALMQTFIDAGIPNGVVGLVFGNPSEISSYLTAHPVIRKISFTGSTAVGKMLAAAAGQHMKRATMELGSHPPPSSLPMPILKKRHGRSPLQSSATADKSVSRQRGSLWKTASRPRSPPASSPPLKRCASATVPPSGPRWDQWQTRGVLICLNRLCRTRSTKARRYEPAVTGSAIPGISLLRRC